MIGHSTVPMVMVVMMMTMPMIVVLRVQTKAHPGRVVSMIGRMRHWRHALQLQYKFPLRPQRPQTDDDHQQSGDQREPCLDALRHHAWHADRGEYADQHDAAGVRQRDEYSQNHRVDGPASRADDISGGDSLAATWRRGVDGADPEGGGEVDQGIGHGR